MSDSTIDTKAIEVAGAAEGGNSNDNNHKIKNEAGGSDSISTTTQLPVFAIPDTSTSHSKPTPQPLNALPARLLSNPLGGQGQANIRKQQQLPSTMATTPALLYFEHQNRKHHSTSSASNEMMQILPSHYQPFGNLGGITPVAGSSLGSAWLAGDSPLASFSTTSPTTPRAVNQLPNRSFSAAATVAAPASNAVPLYINPIMASPYLGTSTPLMRWSTTTASSPALSFSATAPSVINTPQHQPLDLSVALAMAMNPLSSSTSLTPAMHHASLADGTLLRLPAVKNSSMITTPLLPLITPLTSNDLLHANLSMQEFSSLGSALDHAMSSLDGIFSESNLLPGTINNTIADNSILDYMDSLHSDVMLTPVASSDTFSGSVDTSNNNTSSIHSPPFIFASPSFINPMATNMATALNLPTATTISEAGVKAASPKTPPAKKLPSKKNTISGAPHSPPSPLLATTKHKLKESISSSLTAKNKKLRRVKSTSSLPVSETSKPLLATPTTSATTIAHPFICDVCHKSYLHKNSLRDHKRVHTKTRQYPCQVPDCGKVFLRSQDLNRHGATHLKPEEKRFLCPLGCGRVFGRADAAQRHALLSCPLKGEAEESVVS